MLKQSIKWWLLLGVFMLIMQVVIGGITRLTGSGLSITKWEIVVGTFPPTSAEQWEAEFELYKATPQYELLNEGMSMAEFQFIYFWEYFHRLWARSMGFVFLIPFLIYLRKGLLEKPLIRQLMVVVGLAAVVAAFGWIMVASGLQDKPWVSPYKLTLHLNLALVVFGYMVYITQAYWQKGQAKLQLLPKHIGLLHSFLLLLAIQLVLGGLMSGMKAGLDYPTFPDMRGDFIPDAFWVMDFSKEAFIHFDRDANLFAKTFIHVLHRFTAYALVVLAGVFAWQARDSFGRQSWYLYIWLFSVALQVALGIFTVISCVGRIPVGLGVAHQAGAIFLLATTVMLMERTISRSKA